MKTYRILCATRNSGMYAGDQVAPLEKSKRIVRGNHPGLRLRWRDEGVDICAYAAQADMAEEEKAVARLRPVTE